MFFIFVMLLITFVHHIDCQVSVKVVHEDDILKDIWRELFGITRRKAVGPKLRWTNNTVPYDFSESVKNTIPCIDADEECNVWAEEGECDITPEYMLQHCAKSCNNCGGTMAENILKAIDEWEMFTCLKFRPRKRCDKSYILFKMVPNKGCYSTDLGQVGGIQIVNIEAQGCNSHDTILHEIGHAIGLAHEHQRPDRDEYITVVWDNILEDLQPDFEIDPNLKTFGVPYDYMSVMHYKEVEGSENWENVTMVAKDPYYQDKMGYFETLSLYDIQITNKMYKCPTTWYQIRHVATGKYLDSWNGVVLYVKDCTDGQLWTFDGKHIINKKFPNKVLSITKATDGWADVEMQNIKTKSKDQEWERLPWQLQNEWNHKEYKLGVENGSVGAGCSFEPDENFEWEFEKVE